MSIRYDIEADWILLRTCNFRCAYCAIPPAELGGKIHVHATPQQWLDAFNATGKSWLLHLTGGEPSVYPGFVDLCAELTRNHYVSINTNLSHPCLDSFCARIDPARVHYVNAAIHCDERVNQHSLDVFIERARRFEVHGFNLLVSSVMTPQVIQMFDDLHTRFAAGGLCVLPKAMRGRYEGRMYPQSYTSAERSLIVEQLARARQGYAAVISRMGEAPTINMFADERFLRRIPTYRGKLCASGEKFVQIEPDGNVLRCNSGQRLGNILMRDLELSPGPRPCDTNYCPYFCEKYTKPPFVHPNSSGIHRVPRLIQRLLRG